MIYYSRYISLSFIFILFGCQSDEKNQISNDQILWYEQAAKQWEEALPIGNGRLGAMVFGDPISERIQLNDDSLWPKDLNWEHTSKKLLHLYDNLSS